MQDDRAPSSRGYLDVMLAGCDREEGTGIAIEVNDTKRAEGGERGRPARATEAYRFWSIRGGSGAKVRAGARIEFSVSGCK